MPVDPYNLQRFIDAQARDYRAALAEIRAGRKRSHWMWYVFPQFHGLGFSSTTVHFSIKSADEARAYLDHPLLGSRLRECVDALLALDGCSAHQVFGSPDDLKLKSSMTLFARVSPKGSVFERVIDRYYDGQQDQKTIELRDR